MDVCWPIDAGGKQAIALTFFRAADGRLQDVMFETREGASNSVGRCLREVAWTYPWEPGTIPAALDVTPPLTRPSGWQVLAFVRLMSESRYASDRGVLDPAPLVSACLSHGLGARSLKYRILTSPVRVQAFSETKPDVLEPATDVTDSERCITAVLGAAVYPGTKSFELDFRNQAGRPDPAPPSDVSAYFAPQGAVPQAPMLDPQAVKDALQEKQAEVAKCWEAALARRAGLSGGRTVRIRIGANGSVEFAHVLANQSTSPEEAADFILDKCLVEAVKGARFQNATGGPADAMYSWVFAAR